jgi:quercetin dioxygenase-like cupin family protein
MAEPVDVHEQIVEDPVFKQRLIFRDKAPDTLEIEFWVDPGGGVPPHVHPAMEERFTVRDGQPEFCAGRKWKEAGPGETVVVPPGVRHGYRNRGDEVAHVVCHASPPMTLREFLEDAAAMSRGGKFTSSGMPKSWDAFLQAAVMVEYNKDMVVLGFPLPPRPLQRLMIPPLARLGERRGYRAGHFADSV